MSVCFRPAWHSLSIAGPYISWERGPDVGRGGGGGRICLLREEEKAHSSSLFLPLRKRRPTTEIPRGEGGGDGWEEAPSSARPGFGSYFSGEGGEQPQFPLSIPRPLLPPHPASSFNYEINVNFLPFLFLLLPVMFSLFAKGVPKRSNSSFFLFLRLPQQAALSSIAIETPGQRYLAPTMLHSPLSTQRCENMPMFKF